MPSPRATPRARRVAAVLLIPLAAGDGRAPRQPPRPRAGAAAAVARRRRTVAARLPVTDNPFLPPDKDLTECVSANPQPGCGSKAHGGWRQALMFVVVALAMAFIGWRIVVIVRRNRKAVEAELEEDRSPVDGAEFRARGHELIDWIADHVEGIEHLPRGAGRSRPATCGPGSPSTRRPNRSRGTPCGATSTTSSSRASCTGSTRASSPTSRRTRRTRRSSASCSPPGSACRA